LGYWDESRWRPKTPAAQKALLLWEASKDERKCFYLYQLYKKGESKKAELLSECLKVTSRRKDDIWSCYLGSEVLWAEGKEAETFPLLKLAATQGHARAQRLYGHCYLGGFGVPKDDKVAVEWFKRSLEQGDIEAPGSLAICYLLGRGVEKVPKEAERLYRLGIERGSVYALTTLAMEYEYGNFGIKKDHKEALRYYTLAAKLGGVYSQYKLGCCYEQGELGVMKDIPQAKYWYSLAQDDSEDAQKALQRLK